MKRSTLRPKPLSEAPEQAIESTENLGAVSQTRLKIGEVVDHPWYDRVQKVATYASVFGETAYRGGCGLMDMPADESVADVLRLGPLPIFAGNFGMKLAAQGPTHMKTPEAWIDMLSIAAESSDVVPLGNTRLARLVKSIKGARQVAKFMRVAKAASGKKSLEDKSMDQIQQDFTWFMMGILGTMPLVADFKDLDYSDPLDTAREIGFNVGMIGMAKAFSGRVRKTINQNYTQTLDGSRDRVHQMIEDNPELAFLKNKFEYFDNTASDHLQKELGLSENQVRALVVRMREADQLSVHPSVIWKEWTAQNGVDAKYEDYAADVDDVSKDEILVIVEGLLANMIDMKDLINPVGEDLELDEEGNIKTKSIDAVVMVTDLRNFTSLTTSKVVRGNIFGFLKLTYFSYLKEVIKKHGGKILNHTGDGLVIYFKDGEDESKEARSVACSEEINSMTNLMDKVWCQQGVSEPSDNHQTGIGLSAGTIRIGDVLTLSEEQKQSELNGPESSVRGILDVQHAFEQEAARISDWIDVNADEKIRQGGISRLVGMGEPINLAARLESISKAFPNHTGFVRKSDFDQLPPELQAKYVPLEDVQLKGVEQIEMVYGLPRYAA